jgi:hypothetical protein
VSGSGAVCSTPLVGEKSEYQFLVCSDPYEVDVPKALPQNYSFHEKSIYYPGVFCAL